MRKHSLLSLLPFAAVCGAALLGTALPVAADWLITREGDRIETLGPWKVQGKRVVFTLPDGTLSSLRVADVDFPASEKATAPVQDAPMVPDPASAEPRKPRTVLTNDTVRPSGSEARRIEGAPAAGNGARTSGRTYEIGLTGERWVVSLELPGYVIRNEQERSDHLGKNMEATESRTGMVISVYVERERNLDRPQRCRDFYWSKSVRSPLPKIDISFSERPSMALVTWMVPEFRGNRVMQRNVNAYLNRGDVCVDVHLSKLDFHPAMMNNSSKPCYGQYEFGTAIEVLDDAQTGLIRAGSTTTIPNVSSRHFESDLSHAGLISLNGTKRTRENGPAPVPLAKVLQLSKSTRRPPGESPGPASTPDRTAELLIPENVPKSSSRADCRSWYADCQGY